MDETLLIQLSAYADGEADAETTRVLEERLAREPELQRALAKFLALDLAAKRETIPALPAVANEAELMRTAREVLTPAEEKLEVAARAMPVPAVSDEKFQTAWMAIARRIENDRKSMDVMALDDGESETPLKVAPEYISLRRTWQILDKVAQREDAPQLDGDRSAEAWNAVALETVAVPEQSGAWVAVLDDAAHAIAVPQPSAERFNAIWTKVSATLVQPASANVVAADRVPQVSEQKWNKVWSEVQRKTTGMQKSAIPVDFTPIKKKSNWGWGVAVAAAMAAAVAMVLSITPPAGVPIPTDLKPTTLAMNVAIPEMADDRYELGVLYLPDQTQPVVTMFLKDAPPPANFRWMPE